ncbi:MAG TPA: hypothetical protein VG963_07265, partial [Polyangiaceae bacterium]|nr:hypothetical protein [Polyangiaceae bacterium]
MYAYSVYGLTLQSDFPIPELPNVHAAGDLSRRDDHFISDTDVRVPAQSADAGQPDSAAARGADIVVRRGNIPASPAHLAPNGSTGSAVEDAVEGAGDSWAER